MTLWRQTIAPFVSLFTSAGTLICCALPALLVSIGAGATLAGLVSAVPELVWLSKHKEMVFGGAAVMLVIAGILQYRARNLPCPADKKLAKACAQTRTISVWIYGFSVVIYMVGFFFAFIAVRVFS